MPTSFTLAAPKAVSFRFPFNGSGSPISGQAFYLNLHLASGYKDILDTYVHPMTFGSPLSIYNDTFWMTAVLPAGSYTIASDAGCLPISGGRAGLFGYAATEFLVSA